MTKLKPPPVKVPLGEAIGKMIVCPDCGSPAAVGGLQAGRVAVPLTARFWTLVRCQGVCGSKLFKTNTPVELQPDPEPEVITKPLGQVVGQFVACPIPDCGLRSRAIWDADNGHTIVCPVHQHRHYDPETKVTMA